MKLGQIRNYLEGTPLLLKFWFHFEASTEVTPFNRSVLTHFRRCLTERRIIREALNTHGFARDHINDGSISRFQEFGAILQLLAGTTINLLFELSEFARNVSSMAIQHRGITSANLARVVQDNNLENHES